MRFLYFAPMKHALLSALVCLLVGTASLNAQRQFDYNRYTAFNLGVGVINEEMPEGYRYNPITLLPAFSVWRRGHFSVYAEGQFVWATLPEGVPTAYEFGANLGVRFQTEILKQLVLGAAIGAGPHYITVDTRMQADGFIFSDNFELGLSYYLDPEFRTAINLKGRMRHISNAGLQTPNWGLDNFFVVAGLRRRLR